MVIEKLYQLIQERQKSMPENSYITSLFKQGNDRIVQKVGEEATEVIIAAKNKKKKEIISEVADLLFHLLVLLAAFKITPTEIFEELERRKK